MNRLMKRLMNKINGRLMKLMFKKQARSAPYYPLMLKKREARLNVHGVKSVRNRR